MSELQCFWGARIGRAPTSAPSRMSRAPPGPAARSGANFGPRAGWPRDSAGSWARVPMSGDGSMAKNPWVYHQSKWGFIHQFQSFISAFDKIDTKIYLDSVFVSSPDKSLDGTQESWASKQLQSSGIGGQTLWPASSNIQLGGYSIIETNFLPFSDSDHPKWSLKFKTSSRKNMRNPSKSSLKQKH